MSWSLQVKNGDLRLEGTSLATVTGHAKLQQDLRCALLERQGSDPLHPTFGSLIDGGRLTDGTVIPSPLGDTDFNRVALTVSAEIKRVAREHQRRQLARIQEDKRKYGKPTLSSGEVLQTIRSVNLFQIQDTLLARVAIETVGGELTLIDMPLNIEYDGPGE